jgi:hypothetical protein
MLIIGLTEADLIAPQPSSPGGRLIAGWMVDDEPIADIASAEAIANLRQGFLQ